MKRVLKRLLSMVSCVTMVGTIFCTSIPAHASTVEGAYANSDFKKCEMTYGKNPLIKKAEKNSKLQSVCSGNEIARDEFETNDSIQTATTGVQNRVIRATIHNQTDVDYYRLTVNSKNEEVSILLYNIPNGCNYDLYLFNADQSGWYTDFKEGNDSEEFYLVIDEPGTYYVAVDSNSGYSANAYSLYFGKSKGKGSTNWVDPKYDFTFGNVPRGSSAVKSAVKHINLTNEVNIPNNATVKQFYLKTGENTSNWAGFYKYVKPGNGKTYKAYGNLDYIQIDEDTLVRQDWSIWGSVEYSLNFIWHPQYLIIYEYRITPQTVRYLTNN